jgi:uncharacterized protein YbjQ (UPF0145 family)
MAALQRVGLQPVGEVMGCVVEHIGWQGYGCGMYSGFGGGGGFGGYGYSPTQVSGGGFGYGGYEPYVQAIRFGYEQSLNRLLLEASALGADGIVGIRWTQQRLDDAGNREFVALGTAVRASSATRPARLFSTDLSGEDVTKMLLAGWVPTGLALGISVAIRHDDYYTRAQASAWSSSNQEVTGYTELVSQVRSAARQEFQRSAARRGGDAAIVSGMTLNVWEIEPSDNHRDHIAEAAVFGTSIAAFPIRGDEFSRTLSVLPLKTADRRRGA